MSLAKLDNSQDPKIVLVTNSAINYAAADGETKQRSPKTAALDMIKEGATVSGFNLGTVTASFKQYGKWENYFLNKNQETGSITLRPASNPNERENFVYVNPITTQDGKSYYAFNEKSEAGRNFVQGLSTKEWQNDKGEKFDYVEGRVTLKNDGLKEQLKAKENQIAIISRNGFEVKNEADLKKGAKEVSKAVDKEIETAKIDTPSQKQGELER